MATVRMGTIRERKDRPGTHEAVYWVNGKRRRVLAHSREELLKELNRRMEDAKQETESASAWDSNITLEVYTRSCLDLMSQDIEPKTAENYRQLMNAHVLPFKTTDQTLGQMKVRDIKLRHITALVMTKRKEEYAKNTVRLMRSALSSILTEAVDDEIITSNPALQLSNRKRKKADRKNRTEFEDSIQAMDSKQLAAFSEAARAEREFGVFFITLGKTGLRPSEAIALTQADLDLEKGLLRVNKAYASERVRPYTKTGRSRDVDLSQELVGILRAHIAKLREEAFKKGRPMPEQLFPNRAQKCIDWNNAVDAFHRICKKAKIARFRPYDLRHTFASLLLARGTPITYVSEQLGHENPTTTFRYYAKWLPREKQRRYVDMLDAKPEADKEATAEAAR